MRYREIQPDASAARFVRWYWVLEDDGPESDPHRSVPDGRSELIFNLGSPYECRIGEVWRAQPQCFLFGQITGPLLVRRPGAAARMIGIRFHPHTAGLLLKIHIGELTDAAIPLEDLSPVISRDLQRLGESDQALKTFEILDGVVNGLAKRADSEDALLGSAVRELELTGGSARVDAVADWAGMSARQLERRFLRAVGIPPKLYGRMRRFQRVFGSLESNDGRWADVALRCGYYDQAHLIRDFREFAGKPPAALLARDSDLARHFLDGARMSHFSKTRDRRSR